MVFKLEQTTADRALDILTAQLNSTIQLRAHVRQMESKLRKSDRRVTDLLRSISRELWAIIELTNSRTTALGKEGADLLQLDGDASQAPLIDKEDSLEDLLNRFCRYERSTSGRRALARGSNDIQTVMLLDHILSVANRSIRFLDIYACAMWLKYKQSDLPAWTPVSAFRASAN